MLLGFQQLVSDMFILQLLWFRSHTRRHNLILLLRFLQIMEDELFKDFILVIRVAQFLGHQSGDKHEISELVMLLPASAPRDHRVQLELILAPQPILKHLQVYHMPVD